MTADVTGLLGLTGCDGLTPYSRGGPGPMGWESRDASGGGVSLDVVSKHLGAIQRWRAADSVEVLSDSRRHYRHQVPGTAGVSSD
jgi:hypothetical protein